MSQAEFNRDDISKYLPDELEKTKQKLRFFENALSFSTDHIFIFDNKTRFLYINPAGRETLGITSDEFIGKEWSDIRLPREVIEPFDSRLRAVYAAKKPIKGEIEYSIDNKTKYFEYTLNPVVNDKNEVESVIVISRDVTERKMAEETLSENDYYNRSLLRLYKELGRATTYTEIVEALKPEIQKTIGYNSVFLQLVRGDYKDLLLLDAGGPVEKSIGKLIQDERFRTKIGSEDFLILPLEGDPYLTAAAHSDEIYILEDALTNELTNKEIVKVTQNHTIVTVPLILAEKKLGLFNMTTIGREGIKVPNQRQIEYLETLANHVAVAIDRVRFVTERKEREKELQEDGYYNRSLLRLYKKLGQATNYTEIIKALRPEIRKTIGYKSAYLQLIQGGNTKEWFMLDAGGTAETKAKELMGKIKDFQVKIGGEDFLVIPVEGDPFLAAVSKSNDVLIVKDVRDDPLIKTELQKKIIRIVQNRTIVTVPLALAERTLGYFVTGTFGDEEGVLVPNPKQLDYLRTLANHVAVAIDRVRFVTEGKEREKELQKELEECKKRSKNNH